MCRRDGNSGALGTRNVAKVDIDSDGFVGAMDFLLCHGDGAEQEIGDVGQHGGSTSGDEVVSEELVEFRERVVDADGCGEFVAIGGEEFAKSVGLRDMN